MADDFEVYGADQFLRLSKALKHAGHGQLRKDLTKGLRDAAKPLVAKTRAEALRRLPQEGGLAKQVAKEPQRVQIRTGSGTAGVRVVVGQRRGGARGANQGMVRHPVFGDQERWVDQKVPPGWFDDPIRAHAPQIRRDLQRVLEDMADRIAKEVS